MEYAILRGTDLKLSKICLGTPEFGTAVSKADSFELMDAFVDMGGNFLDTAHIYADWLTEVKGVSEITIGEWIAKRNYRDKVVVATKGGTFTSDCPVPRLAPELLTGDLKLGLQRLGFDYVDLYWLHRDDVNRPVEEIMDTLDSLRKQGLIRWYAASNWTVPRLKAAAEYAKKKGIPTFAASQIQWSLAKMNPEGVADPTMLEMDDNTLQFHRESGMPVIPFSSQANGFFSGKYIKDQLDSGRPHVRMVYGSERNWGRLERVMELSKEYGCTSNQLALGYLMSQTFQGFPIVGCRKVEHLVDSCGAASIHLTAEQVKYLEEG